MPVVARKVLLGVLLLLAAPAWAGTPAEEADRCTRYLDAVAHSDVDAAIAVMLERLKPGETPGRFIRSQKSLLEGITSRGSPLKSAEKLPDRTIELTGDIIRRQKWTLDSGRDVYAGCVIYSGVDVPWILALELTPDEERTVDDLTRAAMSGMPDHLGR